MQQQPFQSVSVSLMPLPASRHSNKQTNKQTYISVTVKTRAWGAKQVLIQLQVRQGTFSCERLVRGEEEIRAEHILEGTDAGGGLAMSCSPNVTFLKKGSRWALAWGDVTLPDMPLEERGSPWDSGGSSASRSRGSTSKATLDMSMWADGGGMVQREDENRQGRRERRERESKKGQSKNRMR